jgi:hypothetical protein
MKTFEHPLENDMHSVWPSECDSERQESHASCVCVTTQVRAFLQFFLRGAYIIPLLVPELLNYEVQACRPEKLFFLASICRANTDPPVTKIPNPAMGFFLGVDQH